MNNNEPRCIMAISMSDVSGTATLSLNGNDDDIEMLRQVLIVNNVYFALPDQSVVEFNMADNMVEIWANNTDMIACNEYEAE